MDAFTIADVSFWGPYTIGGTIVAGILFLLILGVVISSGDGEGLAASFVIPGVLWGIFVGLVGLSGVMAETERLKTEEMSRIGYANLSWNGDEFTGSNDGYYVVGFIKQHGDVYYVTDITRKGELV